MTRPLSKLFLGALSALALMSVAGVASAETPWERAHPRRDEVVDRLHHQNLRIDQEVREGELSRAQAARLHYDDRRIYEREQYDARHDDGHITLREQYRLNRAENRVSRRIGS
jgi:hypothetical protein